MTWLNILTLAGWMRCFTWNTAVLLAAGALQTQTLDLVPVTAKHLDRKIQAQGELAPFLSVAIHAKVAGFVEKVNVDVGSTVKAGDVLAVLVAPELAAQRAEAEAKALAIDAQRAEVEARLVSAESTFQKLKAASATQGAVAGNDILLAQKASEAYQAQVRAIESAARAARAAVEPLRDMERYLTVAAPFDGVITQRFAHPGTLAGKALFQLDQNAKLRLIVSVPEAEIAGIAKSARISFLVPAYPGQPFTGTLARVSQSMDAKTRSMAVELDVDNAAGRLVPGMYASVAWPVRKPRPSMLVPPTAVVTNTERTFVVRVRKGVAEWVNVAKGAAAGDLVEVYGALEAGDLVVRRASDEIREGSRIAPKSAPPKL